MTTPARADLTNLFAPPAGPEPFRQGEVLSFDPATGANTVSVGGAVLSDLPILNQGDTVNFVPGDAVILLKYRSSWAILGRIIAPGGEALSTVAVDFAGGGASATPAPFTITGSFATQGSATLTTPAWANSLLIFATSTVIASNTSGSTDSLRLITDINGSGGGESIHQCPDSNFRTVIAPVARELGATSGFPLGASTQLDVRVKSNGNTWTNGGIAAFLNYIAVYRKV